ncbi:MAG: hypothetical protein P8L78_12870 [Mariniblastus sp.]|nr:hypothetical protein [Mariniblastus sp.]MDG2182579.1 hypothetical protein [Mariniblastus sp.]
MERVGDRDSVPGDSLIGENRFSMFELFGLVFVFAVAAFFASIGYWLTSLLWLGFLAGIKLGPRSSYPTFLIVVFGLVAGGLFAAAIFATRATFFLYPSNGIDLIEAKSATIAANTRGLLIAGTLVLWVPPILMTVWLAVLPFRSGCGISNSAERIRRLPRSTG